MVRVIKVMSRLQKDGKSSRFLCYSVMKVLPGGSDRSNDFAFVSK